MILNNAKQYKKFSKSTKSSEDEFKDLSISVIIVSVIVVKKINMLYCCFNSNSFGSCLFLSRCCLD